MTRGEKFMKKGKCRNNHCSALSNSAWCDLNSKGDTLKLHDICHNRKCKCQMQITFTPRQFQLEVSGFKNTMKKIFEETKKMLNKFIKPGFKIASPVISAGVVAKSKNPQARRVTSNFLKTINRW